MPVAAPTAHPTMIRKSSPSAKVEVARKNGSKCDQRGEKRYRYRHEQRRSRFRNRILDSHRAPGLVHSSGITTKLGWVATNSNW
jgi:hypothetical protein